MSHFLNHNSNFQNLSCLIKTLKVTGLKKVTIEKEKLQNSCFNISLALFNLNEFFSFWWDGYGYNVTSEKNLMGSFLKLNDSFPKFYIIDILTQQTKTLSFQFCSVNKLSKTNQMSLNMVSYLNPKYPLKNQC